MFVVLALLIKPAARAAKIHIFVLKAVIVQDIDRCDTVLGKNLFGFCSGSPPIVVITL